MATMIRWKSQLVVMCGALTGEMLPIQLVYKGATKRCHPPYNFTSDWLISHSPNHWSNEITMINEVIVPCVDWKRDNLGLGCDYPAVAAFDHFKGTKKLLSWFLYVL